MTWTKEKIELLKKHYHSHTHKQIGIMLGFTTLAVKSKARVLGLNKVRRLTEYEISLISKHYADTLTRRLAYQLRTKESTIYNVANRLGLKKSKAFLESSQSGRLSKLMLRGYEHRFKKGQESVNKGKRQQEFMSDEAIERSKSTRFKKGNIPHNAYTEDGIEKVRVSKGKPYIYVRIGLGVWREKHRILWEAANGKIEKGYNIQFKDGNTLNCTLQNLYKINRSEQLKQNTIHRYPDDIKRTIITLSKLKRKLKEYEKQD